MVIAVVHTLESLYTFSLCKSHRTGFVVGVSSGLILIYTKLTTSAFWQALYTLSTIIFGYPVWVDLRKRIQNARIESVMKVE